MVNELRPIREFAGQPLEWMQLGFSSEYELHAGEDVVAALHGPSLWGWGLRAVGESTDGTWHFDSVGLRLRIRASGSKTEGPRLTTAWLWQDQWLVGCKSGLRYRWKACRFADEAGEPLVHFKSRFALFKSKGEVRVELRAASNPDLSLLTLLGWYLMILDSFPEGPEHY